MPTFLLLLIVLILLANTYFFWSWWLDDQRKRQADIEHVLRLITTYRRARTAEEVGHVINAELLETISHAQQQTVRRAGPPRT
jgi:hypothetical protein